MTNCKIEGCQKHARKLGMCSMHYERQRVHGDPTITHRYGQRKERTKCIVEDCYSIAVSKGHCAVHYGRILRHGSTDSKIPNYGSGRTVHKQGYIRIRVDGRWKMEHVHLAEKALGKPLPPKAVVHHMNEKTWDNYTPYNLIVCPNQEYHFLLHKRMREYEARQKLKELGFE